jgi:hypothetical protein
MDRNCLGGLRGSEVIRGLLLLCSLVVYGCTASGEIKDASYAIDGDSVHFYVYLTQEEVNKISENDYHVYLFVYGCNSRKRLSMTGLDYGPSFLGESRNIKVTEGVPFVGIQTMSKAFTARSPVCFQLEGGSLLAGQYRSNIVRAKYLDAAM